MPDTTTAPPQEIFKAFAKWINQRAGLDPANYGCHPEQLKYSDHKQRQDARRAMRGDARTIQQDGTRARQALEKAQSYPYNGEAMKDALNHAFSGRLSWTGTELDYTTGQYWPTEYRIAAAVVLETYAETVRPKHLPGQGVNYTHVAQIKEANYQVGGKWFDRGNMRFFRSRVYPEVFSGPGGIYFVSSEKQSFSDETRRYTVRRFNPATADIGSAGEFQGYATKSAAQHAARGFAYALLTDKKEEGAA